MICFHKFHFLSASIGDVLKHSFLQNPGIRIVLHWQDTEIENVPLTLS